MRGLGARPPVSSAVPTTSGENNAPCVPTGRVSLLQAMCEAYVWLYTSDYPDRANASPRAFQVASSNEQSMQWHTHASQCAKNRWSLVILSPRNQPEVMVIETTVAATRTTDRAFSPFKKVHHHHVCIARRHCSDEPGTDSRL